MVRHSVVVDQRLSSHLVTFAPCNKACCNHETLQGLHLPNLVEKVCQKGSRLRHLHLEELNQPPDNTSLLEEDPIVSIFSKGNLN